MPVFHSALTDDLELLALALTTCEDPSVREPRRALLVAERAVKSKPGDGRYWRTLGLARYRCGEQDAAIEALNRALVGKGDGDTSCFFFLAMAHWQKGDKGQSRMWYDKAVARMEKNRPRDRDLLRLRARRRPCFNWRTLTR